MVKKLAKLIPAIRAIPKKMPRFIVTNKPRDSNMRQILVVLIALLFVFTIVYAFKVFGAGVLVENFNDTKLEIILIYSDSCPHCVQFKPTFDAVAANFPHIAFNKIPAAQAANYSKYTANGIPVVLFVKDGIVDETKTLVGNMSVDVFSEKVKSWA